MINRRSFLQQSSLVTAATVGFPYAARPADPVQARPGQKPDRIIHMVADGMSMGTLTCADHYSRQLRGRGLTWMAHLSNPKVHSGWMNMRSLNSLVTDSSAASSSWGSGTRIINGMVNMMGDGTPLKTLYELFAEAGWKRGLVTTTEITHATPAGFATSMESRDHAEQIAAQYLERRIDLLLGGGRKFFDPAERKDKRDLQGEFRQAGYHTMETLADLLVANLGQRWLGIFSSGHLPFTVDHKNNPNLQRDVPNLVDLTYAALARLEREPRFILQVEGGRVDHGCHNCDAAGALNDMITFDEALDVVLAFQQRHPDTLVVVTTDHGNGNLGLNGTGSGYGQSNNLFANLAKVRASFPEMTKQFKRKVPDGRDADGKEKTKEIIATPEEIVEIVRAATDYDLPLEKARMFAPFIDGKGKTLYDLMNSDVAQLGQLMGNYLGIGWTGNAHTADYVPISATGPGAERFAGFLQNTQVFDHYLALADIDFRNPTDELITDFRPESSRSKDVAAGHWA